MLNEKSLFGEKKIRPSKNVNCSQLDAVILSVAIWTQQKPWAGREFVYLTKKEVKPFLSCHF